MTNHWVDLKNADLVIVMGGNAAEAHPCGFKWVIEAKKDRKAKLIVVDPRFTRSAAVSDFYAPIRAGSDIAFLGGVINYLLSNNKIHLDYVKNYTNAAFLIDEGFKFEDGLFSGYNAEKRSYGKDTWKYQIGKDGFAMVDPTLESPNCVFQLLKKHYSRYTPDLVSKTTGTPKDAFLKICEMMAETAAPDKTMTICYALGWTEHSRRLAEHPHHGPDPAPARQHGHGRRRHQRAARPRQRAGHHRHVPVFGASAAGLPVGADRCRRRSQDLSGKAHAEGCVPTR
jgi:anaerobic selenocysteine-containing dehydrogenase